MKDRIINLVGSSGSGKTTISKKLEKIGYNIIHSYTTRKPREINEWGHKFISRQEILDMFNINCIPKEEIINKKISIELKTNPRVIAHKELYGEHYFATIEQYKGKGTSIYVIDPEGAEVINKTVKDAEIITIFLQCDKSVREDRLYKRYLKNTDIEEMRDTQTIILKINERIEKDKEIFRLCKCDYVVEVNRDIKEIIKDITTVIEEK
ncbi:putative guanylate kinase [Gottschalkia acidurici 9a]|uniref:Guanylate kinase n=1 Tax=Gottschalkia acidurici (strain ATCC 7906 / DSM 604 / BCRC 14475 / CIP 104303 / KCTC 5404 / NCIMB 10678 / 9a) TaxID=1128398 RepID=K0AXC4_GOTA9|nr:AAA family ATPase [Gottschalkia acidurici]AFS78458.1 putative guanylate kinase [Gottschalkia acidurici 9a]